MSTVNRQRTSSTRWPWKAESIGEFRTQSFRASMRRLLSAAPTGGPARFDEIADDWREDAYRICYFFEYIGAFIAFDVIEESLIISLMGSQVVQVWSAMKPYTESERLYRTREYPPDTSTDFLPHFGWLADRIEREGGAHAPERFHRGVGIPPQPPVAVTRTPAA
ncbi:MAG TPA: hypothetical protein VIZ43_29620 [Trebonia sp.]